MMLPGLSRAARSRSNLAVFGGYDHTPACGEGTWYEEENLSARAFPALTPRLARTCVKTLEKPHGLYAKNGLIWVDGTQLFYNGSNVGKVADSDKRFCGIGTKVLIFPDKLYLDTADCSLHTLGAKWVSIGNVSLSPTREDGESYTVKTTGATAPETPENGEYWLDTSGDSDVLRVYSAAETSWNAVPTTYLKLAASGIGSDFARYDTVTVSGVSAQVCGEETAQALNCDLVVWNRGEDYLIVSALIDKTVLQSHDMGEITVERRVPDLDFVTESDNRVWGCSNAGHEIFACKLGDPTNWYSYLGTAADSFAATVGSDGDFTGAEASLGYVLFFKENLIHKVYGTKPANYQVTTTACRGVRSGAEQSLAAEGESLFYLASDGIMQYDGSLPSCISRSFGPVRFTAGAAGAAGGEVRVAAQDAAGQWKMYCYHIEHAVWHCEDTDPVLAFAASGDTLYWLCESGELWAAGTVNDPYAAASGHEKPVSWYAETGDIGLTAPGSKFVSRMELQLEIKQGAVLRLAVQYDGSGRWEPLCTIDTPGKRSVLVPVPPHRYHYLRLRLTGSGESVLYAMSKLLQTGSEL